MEILGLLKQLGDLAAMVYAAIAILALGLFFWDPQRGMAKLSEPVGVQGLGAAAHAGRSSATLQPTA